MKLMEQRTSAIIYNEQSDIDQDVINKVYNDVTANKADAVETINLFDEHLIKAAVKKLKTDKVDVSGQFTSDCLKSAPDIFFSQLAALFRSFLTHGYISQDLIVCALYPIVKDPNGDISTSKNYRGIAISSLVLKILDNCILLLFGDLLSNDALQLGFQKGCSTVQCTWAVQETISHYLQGGSEVFCCLLDFSKAFDKVNFAQLFDKLVERRIPAVVLRLILFIYLHQVCFIRWNSVDSCPFRVKNGVRQGAILSPSLFCVYLDSLFNKLREAGIGCHLAGTYLGAYGYADDVTLLAPTREGLQRMLNICEEFAESHSMIFSTDPNPSKSKSKCLFFSRSRTADKIHPVKLNGNCLPWVSTAKHLGNHLSSILSVSPYSPETRTDLLRKRAILFDKIHQVQQQFGQYEPQLVLQLLSIYSTALYGSPLWQLYSEEHQKLNRSWNTAVKIIWNLPYATHTRFLEDLCPVQHLEHVLISRYIGFIQNLTKSSKGILRLIFGSCMSNQSSVTGKNLQYLFTKFQIQSVHQLFGLKSKIRGMKVYALPPDENWKVKLITEIALQKKNHLEIDFDQEDLSFILDFICCK